MLRPLQHPVELTVVYIDNNTTWFGVPDPERKVFLGDKKLSKKEIEDEERIRLVMHDLYLGAQSLGLAKHLENDRQDYFASLYDFSYGVMCLSDEPCYAGGTESNALRIIDEKEAYDLRIDKLKKRYWRYRKGLQRITTTDESLLRNYFEHNHQIDYGVVKACIKRSLDYLYEQKESIFYLT